MQLRDWDDIPEFMRNKKVKVYYDRLSRKRFSLKVKRFFDVAVALLLIVILSPVFLVITIWIRFDSKGPVYYKQERVTQYGRKFNIFKFRTMVTNADKTGALITAHHDSRITRAGKKIRKIRLDEIPQLFNIINGDMSFVGTRPEVMKYVSSYSDEMKATLLLPAGVTSEASIKYKDEGRILEGAENVDETYIAEVLPEKMRWNLKAIREFSLLYELKILARTVWAVLS